MGVKNEAKKRRDMGFPATAKRLDVRWKECPSNLARALHQALHSQDSTYLNDVKLVAAADGGCFQANQMVLASASPFLKQLLLELKEEEPVLVLTGVKAQTLQDFGAESSRETATWGEGRAW